MAGGEMSPDIAIRQIQGNVVGRRPLPKQETNSLHIEGQVRHNYPPGVAVVENGSRVKAPARIIDGLRRIWPAMTYKLIDSLQEVLICFGFDIERTGAEGWGVQPGPGFRRCNRPAVQMACGRGPA